MFLEAVCVGYASGVEIAVTVLRVETVVEVDEGALLTVCAATLLLVGPL